MSKIAIGTRVRVKDDFFIDNMDGVLVGESVTGSLLIEFGEHFKGHDGNGIDLLRGKITAAQTTARHLWFVGPAYVTAIVSNEPKATRQQTDRILNHLVAGKSITQLEAFGVYRIFRLAARIHELKQKGHKIVTNMRIDETGKQYAEYSLATRRVR